MIPCATCGAEPIGTFNDGSPRYAPSCTHPPVHPDMEHPAYRAAVARFYTESGYLVPFVDEHGRLIVPLDESEMAEGEACGKKRLKRAERRKSKDRQGRPSEQSHVLGALGERAVYKWLGVPWECTVGHYSKPDVSGCQVRTVREPKLSTPVHENDGARTPVISVVRSQSRFWIRGWIMAGDARRDEWYGDPGGLRAAWFVPNRSLLPIEGFLDDNRVRAAMGRPPKEISYAAPVPEASAP